jgi:serine/threonine protein kinase/tetratricopeptide (TPR) repeat protein
MKKACPAPDVLAAFASGGLAAESRPPIEQHVSECDECLETVGYLTSQASPHPSGDLAHPSLAAAGQSIGPYQLIRNVGEGGMGEVWEALQVSPVRRTVAVKLLKAGMDTRQIIARFDAERQVLALMQHPGIAQVFDAGITDAGRPYFVMEYVDGIRITAYCDQANLNVHARLALFQQVCEAVQHAHQKGVIHRDLKPSNVLVAKGDRALPKVIDFGLAKATTSGLEDASMTELGTLLGTPAYASPEQMSLGALDVDTRSDVYSLGALLYELLVGVIPFETDGVQPLAELRRAIREGEPTRPSMRLSRLGERLSAIARARGLEPQILRKQLRGDLDWIVMKALEKDRDRRYASPQELSRDIDRYLEHEPLQAGPPTTAYRMRKFVRRHRIGTAFAATLASLVVGFVIVTILQTQRIAEERDRATAEAAKANSINEFLQDTIGSADPWQSGKDISIREVLADAAERAGTQYADQPLLAAEVRRTIGAVYVELGRYAEGEPLLQSALETRRRLLGDGHADVGQTLSDLAAVYKNQSKYEESEKTIREAIRIRGKILGEDDPLVAADRVQLALALYYRGDYPAAAKESEAALSALEKAHGPDSIKLAGAIVALGIIVGNGLGDEARAEALYRRSYEINRKLYGKDDFRAAFSAANLGSNLLAQGKLDAAETLFREAEPVLERSAGKDHPEFATMLENYGNVMYRQERYDECLTLLNRVLQIRASKLGEESPKATRTLLNIAAVQTNSGQLDAAAASYERALPRMVKGYGADHPDVGMGLSMYGRLRLKQHQLDEAESLFHRALAIQESKFAEGHPDTARTRFGLANLYIERKAHAKAEPLLLSVYAARVKAFGATNSGSVEAAEALAGLYTALGKSKEAAEYQLLAAAK